MPPIAPIAALMANESMIIRLTLSPERLAAMGLVAVAVMRLPMRVRLLRI